MLNMRRILIRKSDRFGLKSHDLNQMLACSQVRAIFVSLIEDISWSELSTVSNVYCLHGLQEPWPFSRVLKWFWIRMSMFPYLQMSIRIHLIKLACFLPPWLWPLLYCLAFFSSVSCLYFWIVGLLLGLPLSHQADFEFHILNAFNASCVHDYNITCSCILLSSEHEDAVQLSQ